LTHTQSFLLDARQLAALQAAFHQGSSEASCALAAWIGRPSVVEVDSLEQLPLEEAAGLLGAGDEPICFCAIEMQGMLQGQMILAFDDASGLALADMVLGDGSATSAWTEMATSIALETTNILCCSYLNSLSSSLCGPGEAWELLPSPPQFSREFPESMLEFAFMGQAVAGDHVIVARTRFEIGATPVNWTLLLVPDAPSKSRLAEVLAPGSSE
jgi:chemotaxis protein CheC